ncbi:MAG: Phosphotransferase [Francisellaceae bacterium]|nr:Phosphotransferase [Francisellaceae bacterium]
MLEGLWEEINTDNKMSLIQELGALISEVHNLDIKGLESIDCHWSEFIGNQMKHCVENGLVA